MGVAYPNPPQAGKLKLLAQARGITIRKLIADALAEHGSVFQAAIALGINPNSIHYWMARNDYRVEKRAVLVKKSELTQERGG